MNVSATGFLNDHNGDGTIATVMQWRKWPSWLQQTAPLLGVVFIAGAAVCVLAGCAARPSIDELTAKADAFFEAKQYNSAYAVYNKIIQLDEKNVHALTRLAECCLWLHDSQRGLEWIDKALRIEPASAVLLEKKGELLLAASRSREAIKILSKALELDGSLNVARLNLSLAYSAVGEHEKALEVGQQAVQLAPKDAEAHYCYAQALVKANKYDEAEAEYRRALVLNEQHLEALIGLADLLIRQRKNLTEARRLAQKAYEIRPGDGEAAVMAAWALYLSGERKAALQELRQTVRAHPTNFRAWALLSRAFNELGLKKQARRAGTIAATLAPRRRTVGPVRRRSRQSR